MIAQKGAQMTLYRLKLTDFDPVSPSATVAEVDSFAPAVGVVLPASNGTIEAFDNRILSDPLQRQNFRYVILAGKGLTLVPQALDILSTPEGLYRILGTTPLDPAKDGVILYNVGATLDTQITLP